MGRSCRKGGSYLLDNLFCQLTTFVEFPSSLSASIATGSMFAVIAKDNIEILSFEFESFASDEEVEVEIFTLEGDNYLDESSNPNAWTLLSQTTAIKSPDEGDGSFMIAPRADMKTSIPLRRGEARSFYVSLRTSDDLRLLQSTDKKRLLTGQEFYSDSMLRTDVGVGMRSGSFGDSIVMDRAFQGRIHYRSTQDCQDFAVQSQFVLTFAVSASMLADEFQLALKAEFQAIMGEGSKWVRWKELHGLELLRTDSKISPNSFGLNDCGEIGFKSECVVYNSTLTFTHFQTVSSDEIELEVAAGIKLSEAFVDRIETNQRAEMVRIGSRLLKGYFEITLSGVPPNTVLGTIQQEYVSDTTLEFLQSYSSKRPFLVEVVDQHVLPERRSLRGNRQLQSAYITLGTNIHGIGDDAGEFMAAIEDAFMHNNDMYTAKLQREQYRPGPINEQVNLGFVFSDLSKTLVYSNETIAGSNHNNAALQWYEELPFWAIGVAAFFIIFLCCCLYGTYRRCYEEENYEEYEKKSLSGPKRFSPKKFSSKQVIGKIRPDALCYPADRRPRQQYARSRSMPSPSIYERTRTQRLNRSSSKSKGPMTPKSGQNRSFVRRMSYDSRRHAPNIQGSLSKKSIKRSSSWHPPCLRPRRRTSSIRVSGSSNEGGTSPEKNCGGRQTSRTGLSDDDDDLREAQKHASIRVFGSKSTEKYCSGMVAAPVGVNKDVPPKSKNVSSIRVSGSNTLGNSGVASTTASTITEFDEDTREAGKNGLVRMYGSKSPEIFGESVKNAPRLRLLGFEDVQGKPEKDGSIRVSGSNSPGSDECPRSTKGTFTEFDEEAREAENDGSIRIYGSTSTDNCCETVKNVPLLLLGYDNVPGDADKHDSFLESEAHSPEDVESAKIATTGSERDSSIRTSGSTYPENNLLLAVNGIPGNEDVIPPTGDKSGTKMCAGISCIDKCASVMSSGLKSTNGIIRSQSTEGVVESKDRKGNRRSKSTNASKRISSVKENVTITPAGPKSKKRSRRSKSVDACHRASEAGTVDNIIPPSSKVKQGKRRSKSFDPTKHISTTNDSCQSSVHEGPCKRGKGGARRSKSVEPSKGSLTSEEETRMGGTSGTSEPSRRRGGKRSISADKLDKKSRVEERCPLANRSRDRKEQTDCSCDGRRLVRSKSYNVATRRESARIQSGSVHSEAGKDSKSRRSRTRNNRAKKTSKAGVNSKKLAKVKDFLGTSNHGKSGEDDPATSLSAEKLVLEGSPVQDCAMEARQHESKTMEQIKGSRSSQGKRIDLFDGNSRWWHI